MDPEYRPMAHLPAHGADKKAYTRHGAMAHHPHHREQPACAFNKPPPHRCYCQPSAFQATDGRDYHLLAGGAYGKSVPCGDSM